MQILQASLFFRSAAMALLGVWFGLAAAPALSQPQSAAPTETGAQTQTQTQTPPSASAPTRLRPKVGLVLSGGGARGLSHVGVLKVLERARIPIDVIAGTSMGAIVGGLYASGMSAEVLESELLKVNWEAVFASRVDRQHLSQRRKEEDFEISPVLEFGMRNGEVRVPLGALSGRGLEGLLRRYTLPSRWVRDFDSLRIPFRAVATDMETGLPVVLRDGDLALALRSSMSVPGVFAPTEVNGRILGDGGLVNNLPVDVARAMGAEVVIVVNIGTPLSGREALGSLGGLTGQMINILTEQNVRQSLSGLKPQDVLITPQLGKLTAGDFVKTRELIELGEQGALPALGRLHGLSLSLSEASYAQWRATHAQQPAEKTRLAEVGFKGSEYTFPERYAAQLESKAGDEFDEGKAERDARRLAASGDYTRADFKLITTPHGDGLIFDLEEKPWGPHYFRVGLDMSTDFRGDSRFNIKVSHNRHWLDANGTEWRNRIQIGDVPLAFTELYHPLKWTGGISNDWFVAGYAQVERRVFKVYNNDSGDEQGSYLQTQGQVGIDLGQLWGEFGQLRLGVTSLLLRSSPKILAASYTGPQKSVTAVETGVRFAAVVDQLDFANFPLRGYRVQGEAVLGQDRILANADSAALGNSTGPASFNRMEGRATAVRTWGAHTLNAHLRVQHLGGKAAANLGRFTLGGFHDLSGYKLGQIDGNDVLFGRLTYYRRLNDVPLFTRGLFIGGTLEAGNAWRQASDVSVRDLRSGFSLFFGADTGLGPVYLGLTHAPGGSTGLYFLVGKP